jgi:hypothetical protein
MGTDTDNLANKHAVFSSINAIAESSPSTLSANLTSIYHRDANLLRIPGASCGA